MVFRRENKADAFQRQMSALRNQIGDEPLDDDGDYVDAPSDDLGYDDDAPSHGRGDAGGYSFGAYPQGRDDSDDGYDDRGIQGPSVPEMPSVDSQISVVAQGTVVKGDIQSDGSIQVFGRTEGTLTAKEDVWLAEGSEVDATINARRVIVAGRVNGEIVALSKFEALANGVIEANVQAPTFVVHEGAAINGNLTMSRQETPTSGRAERNGTSGLMSRRPRGANDPR